MERDLSSLFGNLAGYFSQHEVASREEIELVIKDEVSKLSQEVRAGLEKWLEGDLEQVLFKSIVEEPISLYSPDMTAKRNHLGEIFYHSRSHSYPMAEIEQAYKRLVEIRAPSLLANMEKVISHFLEKSGYKLDSRVTQKAPIKHLRLTATRGEYSLLLFLLPSIVFTPAYSALSDQNIEPVMVVPTERTPAPFIQFSRSALRSLEDKGVQVWVVDPGARAVNPFLGYPKDDEIAKNFENPRQSLLAARIFGEHKISRMTQQGNS